jgi:hypothetical protein
LQILYFIFARFYKFQNRFEKKAQKRLKEGSKDSDVNKGKFVSHIDALFAL